MTNTVSMSRGPLMADIAGTELVEAEREFLLHPAVGAVILFSRNYTSPQQIGRLVKQIKSIRSPSLLVAVDQEGGRVQRFRDGFCSLPALNSLGRFFDHSGDKTLAHDAGRLMALELRQHDIDFSFAPVLDTADASSKVIGDRGFHHSAEVIAELAAAYIDGMSSAGMRATGKHFPGHGGVVEDSHHELPVDHRTLAALRKSDLVPYQRLGNLLSGVMTAHVAFPSITPDLPTFSRFWIEEILRQEIGFNGVVFSDDLTMEGAHGAGSIVKRADRALAAGCDMVLVCNAPEEARAVAAYLGEEHCPDQARLEKMAGAPLDPDSVDSAEIRHLVEAITPLQSLSA